MMIIDGINFILKKNGAELKRYSANNLSRDLNRRKIFLSHNKINKIFDVGANIGEYGIELRNIGYDGDIISFEPLNDIYDILTKKSEKDIKWKCANIALGSFDGQSEINVAGNVNSSSILEMLPSHLSSAPESEYVGKQTITIKKFDTIFEDYCSENDNVFLKIDTQGYEKQILEGADRHIGKIRAMQLELSIIPLYKDSIDFLEMIEYLKSKNFELYGIEPGFSDPKTGRLLQFDGIFYNTSK